MTYIRVIPRDLFNEAKLLKCFGQLALKVLDGLVPEGLVISIDENGEPFQIELADDGYLFIANYETTVNGQPVVFRSLYNSKSNWPFYCTLSEGDEVAVFDERGEFTLEFVENFIPGIEWRDRR